MSQHAICSVVAMETNNIHYGNNETNASLKVYCKFQIWKGDIVQAKYCCTKTFHFNLLTGSGGWCVLGILVSPNLTILIQIVSQLSCSLWAVRSFVTWNSNSWVTVVIFTQVSSSLYVYVLHYVLSYKSLPSFEVRPGIFNWKELNYHKGHETAALKLKCRSILSLWQSATPLMVLSLFSSPFSEGGKMAAREPLFFSAGVSPHGLLWQLSGSYIYLLVSCT